MCKAISITIINENAAIVIRGLNFQGLNNRKK